LTKNEGKWARKGAQQARTASLKAALQHVQAWEQQQANVAWVDCMGATCDPGIEAQRFDFAIERLLNLNGEAMMAQI
jgi:hypothetical protein